MIFGVSFVGILPIKMSAERHLPAAPDYEITWNMSSMYLGSDTHRTFEIPCQLPNAPTVVKGIIGLLTVIIILIGVFGNALVCLAIIRRPKMRTVINFFICNLAISDLIYAIICFPLNITPFMIYVWPLPNFMCKIAAYVPAVTSFVSTLTLSAIAVERFCLVVYPLMKPINKTRCFIAIAVIWVTSAIITLPLPIYSTVTDYSVLFGQRVVTCHENWPAEYGYNPRKKYSFALFLIQFFFPFLLVSIAHMCIFVKLSRNVRPGMQCRDSEVRENRRRQRMNRMLSAVVIVFVLCWTPLNIFILLDEFVVTMPCLWMMISQLIAGSSIVMNPILYAWLNENFRTEFIRLLPFLKRTEQPTVANYLQPIQHAQAASSVSRATTILDTHKLALKDTSM